MAPHGRAGPRRGPALLCYDGSEGARVAIRHAAVVLARPEAIVLTAWESVGSALLRRAFSVGGGMGQEIHEISQDVMAEVDQGSADRARATAVEGAQVASDAGLDARPVSRRAIARAGEREEATIWQEILSAAEEEDAYVIVLGSRGRSGLKSMLLGSVSYGVVHHSSRPLLVVPGAAG